MTQEEINNSIYGDKNKYILMLENFVDTLEDTVWMLKNNKQYDENEIYNTIENMRNYCRSISEDNRATGTLMKHLKI